MNKYIDMLLKAYKEDKKKELLNELEGVNFGIIDGVILSVYNHGREEMEFFEQLDEKKNMIDLLNILFDIYEQRGGCWQLRIETKGCFGWVEVNELTIEWSL